MNRIITVFRDGRRLEDIPWSNTHANSVWYLAERMSKRHPAIFHGFIWQKRKNEKEAWKTFKKIKLLPPANVDNPSRLGIRERFRSML